MTGFAGSGAPIAEGDDVVLIDRRGRRYLVELRSGAEWHSHAGVLAHDELIGKAEGSALRTGGNMEIVVVRPTREDFVLKMRRGAQVVYPKDQAMIIANADVRPGCTVVEAGAGSGALTIALLEAVGPAGRVVSFERREDHADIARRNVTRFLGRAPDNWELHVDDVESALGSVPCHRVVLDLLEPWQVVAAAAAGLAAGGILLAYTPTITQVMRVTETLEADGRFIHVRTSETLVRPWDLDGLAVRPAHRMVAHTAFLTTARRVPAREEGGPGVRRSRPRSSGASLRWVDATDGAAGEDEDPTPAP